MLQRRAEAKMKGLDVTRKVQGEVAHSERKRQMLPAMHDVTVHGGIPYGASMDEGEGGGLGMGGM